MIAQQTARQVIDPISAFVTEARASAGAEPAPLVAVDIYISIVGGFATVDVKRTYRNCGQKPIEAMLSLPVPVHAAFFGLTATIGKRILKAVAQPRTEARDQFETAIDEGKTAVLHEELLRGIHCLTVGNLAAGASIEVTTRWAETLRCTGTRGRLRIPMTVGDVYGVSGLADVDELAHGGTMPSAALRIRHDADSASLAGGELKPSSGGFLTTVVPCDAPVDIELDGWKPGCVQGRTWDGRTVTLRIDPYPEGNESMDVAVLVDHSGSMGGHCEGCTDVPLSKHEAVKLGLRAFARQLGKRDRLTLWQFDHTCEPIGDGAPVGAAGFFELTGQLSQPRGGTEIGRALQRVCEGRHGRDILLITDGLSYAVDIQRQARADKRVFVVLVGEDSLDATVGHLAALTGGDMHFSFGPDVDGTLSAAVQGLRAGRAPEEPLTIAANGLPRRFLASRGNASIEAEWAEEPSESRRDTLSEAVAAFAASLALAALNEDDALRLAIGEGLVTHLTSLVLVDEDGPRTSGLPFTRKLAPPSPRTGALYARAGAPRHGSVLMSFASQQVPTRPRRASLGGGVDRWPVISARLDWCGNADSLAQGIIHEELPWAAEALRDLASDRGLQSMAAKIRMDPICLAIAVVAHSIAPQNRHARRVLRRLLRDVDQELFDRWVLAFNPGSGRQP